VIDIHSN